jgi:hypothetical protein
MHLNITYNNKNKITIIKYSKSPYEDPEYEQDFIIYKTDKRQIKINDSVYSDFSVMKDSLLYYITYCDYICINKKYITNDLYIFKYEYDYIYNCMSIMTERLYKNNYIQRNTDFIESNIKISAVPFVLLLIFYKYCNKSIIYKKANKQYYKINNAYNYETIHYLITNDIISRYKKNILYII